MGKKAKEFKAGDFIFAKVKGYPAWPARVQRINGKKYFVYFYGTAEIANLPPNQIFDYAENKDKFLSKSVKRKDFNEGIRQIEHDFTNNVPLEDVVGPPIDEPMETSAVSEADETVNTSMDDSTAADTTVKSTADETNTSQNLGGVEDSDEGALVIDEKKKAKKTPAKPVAKEPKATPKKGKQKKEEVANDEEEKKEEEIISRSGRKIRPKRYIDEHTEDNATLTPVGKKKRVASPQPAVEKPEKSGARKLTNKQCHIVAQSELDNIKEPFPDNDNESILIAYLPSGQYVGIKLFQSKPNSFSTENGKLQWYKTAATNAMTLKGQLEKGQITSQSVSGQLETELNLTDEEKSNLDKEREIEEKKSRVQFLKTEMKLIELDTKIKSCLSLEKADTEKCLQHLNDLLEMEIKPLMLLKHPTCLETIKRSRSYVGNTPCWGLSEEDAETFNKHADKIRDLADSVYTQFKKLFHTPEGLSFWEYFSERVMQFKKCTAKLNADELLEMMHEPIEMSMPSSHTNTTAVEAANDEEDKAAKKKATPVKAKKPAAKKEPSKPTPKKTRGKPDMETAEENTTVQEKEEDKNKTEETKKTKSKEDKIEKSEKNKKEEAKEAKEESNIKDDKTEKSEKNKKEESKKAKEESNIKEDKIEKSEKNKKEEAKKAKEESNMKEDKTEKSEKNKKEEAKKAKEESNVKEDKTEKSEKNKKEEAKKSKESNKNDKKTEETTTKKAKTAEVDRSEKKKSGKEDKKESNSIEKNEEKHTNDSSKEVNDKSEAKEKKAKSKPKKNSEGDSNDKDANSKESSSTEVKEMKKNGQPVEGDKEGEEKLEGEEDKGVESDEPAAKKVKENSKKTEPPPVPKSPGKRKSRS